MSRAASCGNRPQPSYRGTISTGKSQGKHKRHYESRPTRRRRDCHRRFGGDRSPHQLGLACAARQLRQRDHRQPQRSALRHEHQRQWQRKSMHMYVHVLSCFCVQILCCLIVTGFWAARKRSGHERCRVGSPCCCSGLRSFSSYRRMDNGRAGVPRRESTRDRQRKRQTRLGLSSMNKRVQAYRFHIDFDLQRSNAACTSWMLTCEKTSIRS